MLSYIMCLLLYILPMSCVVASPIMLLFCFAVYKVKEAKKKKAWREACRKERAKRHAIAMRHLKAVLNEK